MPQFVERGKAPECEEPGAFRRSSAGAAAREPTGDCVSTWVGGRTDSSHRRHRVASDPPPSGGFGIGGLVDGTPTGSGDETLSVVYGRWKAHPVGFGAVSPASRARDQDLAAAFGLRLRTLRLERGLTQEQLAETADLHPTFISNVERGYSAPTLYTLVRLAEALDVQPGQLVDDLRS
jgi:DNA-binding XRE family transcriptional regulator